MHEHKKLFFASSELKNHFVKQFESNRYDVIDSSPTENYINIADDYTGQALYFEVYDKDSTIDYKMIEAHLSNFPSYDYEFPEISFGECMALINEMSVNYSHTEIDKFKKGIFYCKRERFSELLKIAFEKIFFNKFPNGKIIYVRLDGLYYKRSAMIRGIYSLENYPDIKDNPSDFNGFNTLKNWLFIESHESFDNIIQFSEYFFFPFVTAFHCDYRIGFSFIFVPDTLIEYHLGHFPRDIIDYIRTGSDFGKEKINNLDWSNEHLYAKYCFNQSPLFSEYYGFIIWAVKRANYFIKEHLNICNYLDKDDNSKIDPIYALEYNLSIRHLVKIGLSILSSNSSFFNKNMTFQAADILNDICNYDYLDPSGTLRKNTLFKKLFNKDLIFPIISSIIDSCSFSFKDQILDITSNLYDKLNETIKDSIWLKSKVNNEDVIVRNHNNKSNNIENIPTFTSNVIRALRNTHHGYLTRNDRTKRPSRYLSIIDGNTPDNLSSITLIWLLCLLQDRDKFIGKP